MRVPKKIVISGDSGLLNINSSVRTMKLLAYLNRRLQCQHLPVCYMGS
jgi:hypothetical protein